MNNEIELAPYIEDLTMALENNVTSQDIEVELRKYLDDFDIPIAEAKRCVLRKFGGDPKQLGQVEDKNIKDLSHKESSVNLLCRIMYIDNKTVSIKGESKIISYGILGDQTGTVPFTAWHELECEKGEVIRIYNAYTKSWRDKVQVNLGNRTHVRILSPDALPEFKSDIDPVECKVNELQDGLRNVSTVIRILDVKMQEVTIEKAKTQIFKGVAADETGKCGFTAWDDFKLNVNDVVQVTSGYVKSWRGLPELQLNGGTKIEKLDGAVLPPSEQLSEDKLFTIRDLKDGGAVSGVAIEGVILDIRPGSGLIKRCTECNRVLQDDSCMIHGKLTGNLDLRVKAVLDDGTGALTLILGQELTERLIGLDLSGCESRAKEQMRFDVIYDDIVSKLLARPVRVNGTVFKDEFGLMLIGSGIEMIVPKIKTEAISLLTELGIEMDNEVWEHE